MDSKVEADRRNGPVDKGSDAYRNLRLRLLAYEFPPFTQLNIRDLADGMGVSSTPVREALVRLAHEEIVQLNPGKGFFTKPLSFESVYADFEMEAMILRFSIVKSASTFAAFDVRIPSQMFVNDVSAVFSESKLAECATFIAQFHIKVAQATGNRRVRDAMALCCDRLHHVRVLDMTDRARLDLTERGVSALLGALTRRDADEALFLVDTQFDASTRQIDRVVRDGNARAVERQG